MNSVPNSLKPNMANNIKNHGQYGQKFSQIWPQYGHFFNEFWPYFQFLLHFYVTICAKIPNQKRNFTKCFLKNFQSAWFLPNEENLKILRLKLLEKFVLCHRLSWMLNWNVKFGQNGPKNNQKWPEMSKFFPKAKYGHICHEKKWPWTKNFHGQGNLKYGHIGHLHMATVGNTAKIIWQKKLEKNI